MDRKWSGLWDIPVLWSGIDITVVELSSLMRLPAQVSSSLVASMSISWI